MKHQMACDNVLAIAISLCRTHKLNLAPVAVMVGLRWLQETDCNGQSLIRLWTAARLLPFFLPGANVLLRWYGIQEPIQGERPFPGNDMDAAARLKANDNRSLIGLSQPGEPGGAAGPPRSP